MLLDLNFSFSLHLLVAGKHMFVLKLAHDKFVHDERLTLFPIPLPKSSESLLFHYYSLMLHAFVMYTSHGIIIY